jgi:hypothetical protein
MTTYVAAKSAEKFESSVGVNTKISADNSVYSNAAALVHELQLLGITNVRDGTQPSSALAIYLALAKAGIHFDLIEANPTFANGQVNGAADVARAHRIEAAVPGSVVALEGVNEYTSTTAYLHGASSHDNLKWGVSDAAQLQAAAKADPLFANITLVAPSAIQLASLPRFGSYVSATNAHVYGPTGGQLANYITADIAYAKASDSGKPVYITETGIASYGYTSTWGGTADERNQAIIDANAILDGFAGGAAMTYLYELRDDPTASAGQEQYYGLFRVDGSEKPAGIAVGDIMRILADSGTGGVTPTGLSYSISGLPSTARSMLLEKSNGIFELVLWNANATVYNGASDVTPRTSNVTVSLALAASTVHVYDPVKSATAFRTLTNASTIKVGLAADPVIIEVGPATGAPKAPYVSDVVASGSKSVITGHADAGSKVAVSDNGVAVGTATADSIGKWSLTYTPSSASQHHLTEVATSSGGIVVGSVGIADFGIWSQTYTGTTGPDVFIGNNGDKLTGGAGADTFVFNPGFGKETILDYTSIDRIDFDHRVFADASSVLSHAVQSGSDVHIIYNQWNVLTLHDVALSSLSASHIVII